MTADADVLVVGAGPVGLACALLLARRGWRVTVLERWAAPYAQPRAVHFDDEVARLLADAGLAGQLAQLTEPADIYEWRNGAGRTLLRFDWSGTGPSGWPAASMFHQPALEDALAAAAEAAGSVTVLRGYQAVQLTEAADHVEVTAQDRAQENHGFTASWVIGCDGANSFVRSQLPGGLTDLGFFYDWLIVDVVPNDPRTWDPVNLQLCDPSRPTTIVSGGPGRRRWEFMRMPGETVAELNNEHTAWRLLAPWQLTPENCVLERHAIYTFQARWADVWRSGRLLLAGDSAHLMPPFAGQGMCSGIRDAANLSWKLDLVLRGVAGTALLDSYGPERQAHVQHAIAMSVELGKVICVTDPEQAAGRDAFMISQDADPARILPPLPPSTLTAGVLHRTAAGEPAPGAGVLTPQGRLAYRGRTGLLDDVVGAGFMLACSQDPLDGLDKDQLAFLDAIGTHVLHLRPAGTPPGDAPPGDALPGGVPAAVDLDGTYLAYLAAAGAVAVLIRPDHYLFGAAATLGDLPALISDLRRQVAVPAPGQVPGDGAAPPSPIWRPDPEVAAGSAIARFAADVARRTGAEVGSYLDLWKWSIGNLGTFWWALWEFFDIAADGRPGGPADALADAAMPGARWFPGTRLNYAEHALRHGDDDAVAVTAVGEEGTTVTMTWAELRAQVGALAHWLRDAGVRRGDRVVGYLPNTPPALVAFLACASIGALWSACAQDYSGAGAAARFAQLDPVVLFAADGYRWNGRGCDRRAEVAALQRSLPTLRATVHVPNLGEPAGAAQLGHAQRHHDAGGVNLRWAEAIAAPAKPRFERVDFDAPLWVLFSSGTTGLPKGIVHGHGGVVLEHHKLLGLHLDAGPGRPLFWYTTTNWMMWNIVASALLTGAPVILYDGSPAYPDPQRLWRIAAEHRVAFLGVSPGYLLAGAKAGLQPGRDLDLSALRTLGVTGSPLTAASYHWVHDAVGPGIQVASSSGGTDVVSGFAGSAPTTPVWPGEISAPLLGVALAAWNADGQPVTGEVGELVVTRPMPSMPLYFWNDPDGSRYREAYFARYPGAWRHGDWMMVTERGSVVVSGRSDSTLNRNGVRLGSADIYDVVDKLPEVAEALVIGAELGDGGYWLALFVVLAGGAELTADLTAAIKAAIASQASPRHVPDDVIAVTAIPHTRTGKKLEVPVKRLIQGHPLDQVASRDAVDDYDALAQFTAYARGPAV